MRVRLTGYWGSRVPGSIISVSTDRAFYLQNELRIGRILDEEGKPVDRPEPEAKEAPEPKRQWKRK